MVGDPSYMVGDTLYDTLQEHQKTLTWSKVSDKGRRVFIIVAYEKNIFGMMVEN